VHKLSIYVETSVWSHAFAEDAPESRAATERFLEDAREGKYDLFVSDVVLDEFRRASDELERLLRGLVSDLNPVFLEFDEDCFSLSQEFLQHGIVPPSKVDDARHVAVAVANELDILLSWNYRHLVNVRRREMFHQISVNNGFYKPIQIITPSEVNDAI
jgi:predicted nucleic acid-binding protein